MIYDVVIIGAGVVGGAVARELSRYELSVLCIEKEADVCCGTSKANTGIIHSPALIPPDSLKAEMAAAGAAKFDRLSAELGFGYQKAGALILGFDSDDEQTLNKYKAAGEANYSALGYKSPEYEIIRGKKLFELEPELNPDVSSALFAPDAGRIIPYEYGIALWENAVLNGVKLELNSLVTAVGRTETSGKSPLWQIKTEASSYVSKFIVNAAGHGSSEIGRSAGFPDGKIRKVKGQYLIFDSAMNLEVDHILFQVPQKGQEKKGKGILVTKTVYGNIMIGPDAREQMEEADTSTDLESLDQVIEGALRSVPGINTSKCIKTFAGVRPKPAGGDFIIDGKDNFIHLCGIESPGLTSSPAIADEVLKKLEQMGLELNRQPDFHAERKPIVSEVLKLPPDELKRRIELPDGESERLVCRCELVPESRISDAVSRGIPVVTIDGVKRRTRAGQGRCQGNFCGDRVRALISKELHIPEEEITQRGSEALLDRVSAADIKARYRK